MRKIALVTLVLLSIVPFVSITALSEGYPIFVPDNTSPGLYYWTGTLEAEEDIVSEEECEAIKSLVLPSDMQWFDGYYNYQLEALEEYIVDDSSQFLTCIDGVLFTKDMKTLLAYPRNKSCTEYTIPNGVVSIGENAFAGNCHLEVVTFSDDVVWICGDAFSGCSALNTINLNNALSCIEDRAFELCQNLTELRCPDELKIIGYHAFYMSGLSKITLNDGLTCIMSEAFFTHCFGEAKIILPNTLLYLDRTAFSPDEDITIIISKATHHPILVLDGVTTIITQGGTGS